MKSTTAILSVVLALGSNAVAVPDAELMKNHHGICRVAENQCIIYYRKGEHRVDCRKKCSKNGAPCRIGRIPHRAQCK